MNNATVGSKLDWQDTAALNRFFLIVAVCGLSLISIHFGLIQFQSPVPALLWAFACSFVGSAIGFLFGLTKVEQGSNGTSAKNDVEEGYKPQINTNLIEISDWLTKIIVGLGLIHLKQLPTKLRQISQVLADCLGGECGLSIAIAIIVGSSVLGFLFGYLNTRTVIALVLDAADRQLLRKVRRLEEKLEKSETEKIASEVVTQSLQQAVTSVIKPQSNEPSTLANADPDTGLLQMADAYERIDNPDYITRVRLKDKAVSDMLGHIFEKKISKQALARWAEQAPRDGLIVALAGYVLAVPENGDLQRLIGVARKAIWLHVQFRIALAFRELLKKEFGEPQERNEVLGILVLYQEHAKRRQDASLRRLAQEVMDLINSHPN